MGRELSEQEKQRNRERAAAWYADPENKKRRDAYIAAKKAADPDGMRAANREYSRQWRERNPAKRRLVWMKHKYRLTDEQAQHILDTRGLCESCGIEPANHIDHDHATGAFRGQLCGPCNQAAGLLRDDPVKATALAAYLVRTKAQAIPG